MTRGGLLWVAGAMTAAAIGFSPVAAADELHPPGTIGPIEGPIYTTRFDGDLFDYSERYSVYDVMDGDDVLGQFTEQTNYFSTPFPLFGSTTYSTDVITDSSYPGLSEGATYQSFGSAMFTLQGYQVLFSSDYYNNPGVGTSYYLSLFGTRFPLWDITYDTADNAATESGGLGDLFGVDLGELGDFFGLDLGDLFGAGSGELGDLLDLSGLFGIGPSSIGDLLGLEVNGLTDLFGLL